MGLSLKPRKFISTSYPYIDIELHYLTRYNCVQTILFCSRLGRRSRWLASASTHTCYYVGNAIENIRKIQDSYKEANG